MPLSKVCTNAARAANAWRMVSTLAAQLVNASTTACMGLHTSSGRVIDSAQSFAEALLEEHFVAVVPGEDFGECARENIRISFACSEPNIREGLARLDKFVNSLS